MRYPEFTYTHYWTEDGLQIVHPIGRYAWETILEMTKSMEKEGIVKNLWIGEDTIQYEVK